MTRQSTDPGRKRDRQAVRTVECPRCGATAHQKCIGSRGQPRYASHQERWDAHRASQVDAPTLHELYAALASLLVGTSGSSAAEALVERARRAGLLP